MGRAEAVEQLQRVYALLNQDVKDAHASVLTNPTDFNQRTLIRTYFALIEGLAYQLRHVTLASLEGTGLLSDGDVAILREERHQLSPQGAVEAKDNFQSMLPSLLFALRVYAKNHEATFVPRTSDNGWNCLRKAVDIRDRLTHPKSLADLAITEEDGAVFAAGVKWWNDSLTELFAECEAADRRILASQAQQQ
jgi:hypothetical protein